MTLDHGLSDGSGGLQSCVHKAALQSCKRLLLSGSSNNRSLTPSPHLPNHQHIISLSLAPCGHSWECLYFQLHGPHLGGVCQIKILAWPNQNHLDPWVAHGPLLHRVLNFAQQKAKQRDVATGLQLWMRMALFCLPFTKSAGTYYVPIVYSNSC